MPKCKNTSIATPEKTFIVVPVAAKMRKLWLAAVRRDPMKFSKTTMLFVCEDHFDVGDFNFKD